MTRTQAEMKDAARAAMSAEDRATDDRAMIYTALIMAATHAETRARYWAGLAEQPAISDQCKRDWRERAEEHEYTMNRYRELAAQFGGSPAPIEGSGR